MSSSETGTRFQYASPSRTTRPTAPCSATRGGFSVRALANRPPRTRPMPERSFRSPLAETGGRTKTQRRVAICERDFVVKSIRPRAPGPSRAGGNASHGHRHRPLRNPRAGNVVLMLAWHRGCGSDAPPRQKPEPRTRTQFTTLVDAGVEENTSAHCGRDTETRFDITSVKKVSVTGKPVSPRRPCWRRAAENGSSPRAFAAALPRTTVHPQRMHAAVCHPTRRHRTASCGRPLHRGAGLDRTCWQRP